MATLSLVTSAVIGLFITIPTVVGCGEGGEGSVVNEGVSNNDRPTDGVSSNGPSSQDGNNDGVTDEEVANNDGGNEDVDSNAGGNKDGASKDVDSKGGSKKDVDSKGAGNKGGGTRPSAFLEWSPVKHYKSVTYIVHFGKQSSGQAGSCHYERSGDVSKPHATVTGLEPNTLYFFAVSTYDGYLRSQCSNEVSKLTP